MKLIVKTLMVTFLLSSVGIVYAQGPVDKTKDEIVKEKSSGTKSTKGSSAGRLGGDTAAPTKDASGSGDAVKEKKSFFGRLFGGSGKSSPTGHSSKSAAPSSKGGSSKKGAKTKDASATRGPSTGSGEKELDEGQKDKRDDG